MSIADKGITLVASEGRYYYPKTVEEFKALACRIGRHDVYFNGKYWKTFQPTQKVAECN